jgi:hypothetical protein
MVSRVIDRCFLEHPRGAGQRYFEHLRFAWRFGAALFSGACAAFLHGLLPNLHQTTASQTVNRLHAQLQSRQAAR